MAAIASPQYWWHDAAWAEALFLFAITIPVIHMGCIRIYAPEALRSIPDPWRAI
ncbi:MAG: hypothetical protein OXI38_01670 [Bacteroidota bacterium]|nr:hypothetical protein [Bacteroidota bacterium]